MLLRSGARKLELEVDTLLDAATQVGSLGHIEASFDGHRRRLRVDRVVCNEAGNATEAWLSSDAAVNPLTRFFDRLRRVERRDLLRVLRLGGDVIRSTTRVLADENAVTHLDFTEIVGAPRISRSVVSFSRPRGDASAWLRTYRRARAH